MSGRKPKSEWCRDIPRDAQNVEPMGPTLMFEKVTDELASEFSMVVGSPEVAEHGPRETPGLVAGASVG